MEGWIEAALNGKSTRVPHPWPYRELVDDDLLAGTVVELGKSSLVVAVESGTLAGENLEVGEWRRVNVEHAAILRKFMREATPQVGEKVALRFRGVGGTPLKPQHLFDCGVFRQPVVSPWE